MRFILLALTFVLLFGCHQPQTVAVQSPLEMVGGEPVKAPTVTLHVDVDFTPEERAVLEEACTVWYLQTSHLANIRLVYDLDFADMEGLKAHVNDLHSVVMRMESWMDAVQNGDSPMGGKVLGWVSPGGGVHNPEREPVQVAFVVDRFETRQVALQTVLHEFGHVLGLPHVASRQSIMYPSINRDRKSCLKKADLASFCEVNECGSVRMYPCE